MLTHQLRTHPNETKSHRPHPFQSIKQPVVPFPKARRIWPPVRPHTRLTPHVTPAPPHSCPASNTAEQPRVAGAYTRGGIFGHLIPRGARNGRNLRRRRRRRRRGRSYPRSLCFEKEGGNKRQSPRKWLEEILKEVAGNCRYSGFPPRGKKCVVGCVCVSERICVC